MQKIRLIGWLAAAVVLTAVIYALAPQQLPVTIYKVSLVTVAAVVGYWLDRSLFPYARPHLFIGHNQDPQSSTKNMDCYDAADHLYFKRQVFIHSMLRRAIIIGVVILAMALGA